MKTLKYIVVLGLGVTLLQSCKKGENDPFLSLKTRDARITGEWELKSANFEETEVVNTQGFTLNDIYSVTLEDGILKENYNGTEFTAIYAQTMEIEKGGNVIQSDTYDSDISEYHSSWWWNSNDKKKSMIVIDGSLYEVDRLTNKELVLTQYMQEMYTYSDENETYTVSGELVYEKKK